MSIFEAVKEMTKEEFSSFLFEIYNKGWFDGSAGVDDENWVIQMMADYPIEDWKKVEMNT